jgi:hypothetical protein
MDNKTISEKTGLSPAEVTRILNLTKYGRKVTFRQAYLLSLAFGRSIDFWRKADQKRIRSTIDAMKQKAA